MRPTILMAAALAALPLASLADATLPARPKVCTFAALSIEPEFPDRRETFVGRAGPLLVRFHNERTDGEVTAFPEPPLEIEDARTRRRCLIEDGGVWARQSVHLSTDRRVLMTEEYSGSSSELKFYSTRSCRLLRAVDVSGARWSVEGAWLHIAPAPAEGASPAASSAAQPAPQPAAHRLRFQARPDCLPVPARPEAASARPVDAARSRMASTASGTPMTATAAR